MSLEKISPKPLPQGPVVLLMPCRMLRDKGVLEFVEAARILKKQNLGAIFRLQGDPDMENITSVTKAELEGWVKEGIVEWRQHTEDINMALGEAHIVVLPSYREGLPKTLVDAAAAGRAIATSDVPGCRDAIIPGETGLLFQPRNHLDTARILKKLITNPALVSKMGAAGRVHAEIQFDILKIVEEHIKIYREGLRYCDDLDKPAKNPM